MSLVGSESFTPAMVLKPWEVQVGGQMEREEERTLGNILDGAGEVVRRTGDGLPLIYKLLIMHCPNPSSPPPNPSSPPPSSMRNCANSIQPFVLKLL